MRPVRSVTLLLASVLFATSLARGQDFVWISTGSIATDQNNSSGASWIDYDTDGDLDLFVSSGGGASDTESNALYRNDGGDSFTRIAGSQLVDDVKSSLGNSWADIDNDGDLDVCVAGHESHVYRNDGGGQFVRLGNFTTFGAGTIRAFSCAWGDYDADGLVDLVLAYPTPFFPSRVNYFFRNKGDGTFDEVDDTPVTTGTAPYTIPSWSDFDLDGDLDLFIGAGPTAPGVVAVDFFYRNRLVESGSATFEKITGGQLFDEERNGQVINWIDYDNDGDLDSYITNYGRSSGRLVNDFYRNDQGVYTKITDGAIVTDQSVSMAQSWADYDNDGDVDLFVGVCSGNLTNRYYRNEGDGTFTRTSPGAIASQRGCIWGSSAGDYDDDGDMDLAAANMGAFDGAGASNFVYRNDLGNGNHWLKLRAVGITSNRAAIGTRVQLRAVIGGVETTQLREISAQNSVNGHNSLEVHFGLGDAVQVDEVRLVWPSGTIDVLADLAADQTLTVEEGSTPVGVADAGGDVRRASLAAYPNPFSSVANLTFTLPAAERVTLAVYDLLGREVQTLLRGELRSPGRHTMSFDGSSLASGIYVYRLQVGADGGERILQGAMMLSK